ncbi:hypothetical protein NMG60_11027554 [Bertholletia excelsa]
MAALEAAYSVLPSSLPFPKSPLFPTSTSSIRLRISTTEPALAFSLKSPLCPFYLPLVSPTRKLSRLEVHSAVEEVAVEEKTVENTQQPDQRRKLFVLNLPWSFKVEEIKNLFAECGTVDDVEIIKQKDGKNRGFAFVTMASAEEAQAVMEKFDAQELQGRIIRVEYAKRFKKPTPRPAGPPAGETWHKLYVSNLQWKVRSSHLREFFAGNFNPVSARVVFDSPSGRSAGYGFVSFATAEEAQAAISALNGKELMGRPVRLKLSEKKIEESTDKKTEEDTSEEPQES